MVYGKLAPTHLVIVGVSIAGSHAIVLVSQYGYMTSAVEPTIAILNSSRRGIRVLVTTLADPTDVRNAPCGWNLPFFFPVQPFDPEMFVP